MLGLAQINVRKLINKFARKTIIVYFSPNYNKTCNKIKISKDYNFNENAHAYTFHISREAL